MSETSENVSSEIPIENVPSEPSTSEVSSPESSTESASETETIGSENASSSHESQESTSQSQSKKNNFGEKMVKFEWITGKRRDCTILHAIEEKQLYVKNKKLKDGSIAYTCRERKCNARVYLVDGKCYYPEPMGSHNHENKEKVINEMAIEAKIKKDCAHVQPSTSQTTSQISDVREIFDASMAE